MPGKLVSSCVYNILFILILFNLILLVQALLVFNEGSCCILVPHPSTRRPDRLRSPFQVVRSTVQLLQSTGFIQRGNCLVDSFHRQLQSDFILLPLFLQFLTPLWYPDQIENAVGFLASQVAMSYYGSGRNSLDRFIPNESVRRSQPRQSSPLVHHDSTRCQACKDGWCVASGVFA